MLQKSGQNARLVTPDPRHQKRGGQGTVAAVQPGSARSFTSLAVHPCSPDASHAPCPHSLAVGLLQCPFITKKLRDTQQVAQITQLQSSNLNRNWTM